MEALTKDQQQDLTKYDGIDNYFEENQDLVDSFIPLKDEVILFRANLALIPDIASGKIISTKGVTTTKSGLKLATAKDYGKFVPVARGYCLKKGFNAQAANLRWTQSKLYNLDDTKLLETCTLINGIISELLPNADFLDYGITAATLSAALAKANQFDSKIGLANSIDASKSAKAIDLNAVYDNLHDNNEQFDLLMNHFKELNPDFYNGYVAVNVVIDDVRHTGIDGMVEAEGGGVPENAVITNTKSGRFVKADLLGEYEHVPNRSGLTKFECSAPGYETQAKTIKLKRGKLLVTNWILKPLV